MTEARLEIGDLKNWTGWKLIDQKYACADRFGSMGIILRLYLYLNELEKISAIFGRNRDFFELIRQKRSIESDEFSMRFF